MSDYVKIGSVVASVILVIVIVILIYVNSQLIADNECIQRERSMYYNNLWVAINKHPELAKTFNVQLVDANPNMAPTDMSQRVSCN